MTEPKTPKANRTVVLPPQTVATLAAKLPHLRIYDLRHTAATLLLAGGVHIKVVSEMLGHATVMLTLDTYSHVLEGMQAESAATMARLLA